MVSRRGNQSVRAAPSARDGASFQNAVKERIVMVSCFSCEGNWIGGWEDMRRPFRVMKGENGRSPSRSTIVTAL